MAAREGHPCISQYISVYPVYPPEPVSPYIARVGAMAPREGAVARGGLATVSGASPRVSPMAARGS